MRTIYKYQLNLTDTQLISIPNSVKVLQVAVQNEKICVWLEVNTGVKERIRTFRIYGTGHEIPRDEGIQHIGTVSIGSFVWHVYLDK